MDLGHKIAKEGLLVFIYKSDNACCDCNLSMIL